MSDLIANAQSLSTKSPGAKTAKTKGLGRGLGSLLGSTSEGAFSKTTPPAEKALESLTSASPPLREPPVPEIQPPPPSLPLSEVNSQAVTAIVPPGSRVWHLPIEKIWPNANQPRQVFHKEALDELANSIREKGIIQPILVRKSDDDSFEIIAGERRWRAAQLAGLKEVPALIKETSEQEVLELALIENIQRENLNPLEEAEAYDYLLRKYSLTQAELAAKVGKDRVTVTNVLRILQLTPPVRQMVSKGELSLGQAKVLLGIADPKLQMQLAQKCLKEGLSVRSLEKLIAQTKGPSVPTLSENDKLRQKMAASLAEELQKLLGSKVHLEYANGKGRILINFYSDQELNQIADTLRDSWRN